MNYTPKDGFPYYFELVKNQDCLVLFSSLSTLTLLNTISEEKSTYKYAPNKWSVKQIIGHITDHERIQMHRAFLLSRKVDVPLWGYDQNYLVEHSRFEELTIQQLTTEFLNVRNASLSFIESLSENQLKIKGMARQFEISLEEFLKSIIGHEKHHLSILREKYLP